MEPEFRSGRGRGRGKSMQSSAQSNSVGGDEQQESEGWKHKNTRDMGDLYESPPRAGGRKKAGEKKGAAKQSTKQPAKAKPSSGYTFDPDNFDEYSAPPSGSGGMSANPSTGYNFDPNSFDEFSAPPAGNSTMNDPPPRQAAAPRQAPARQQAPPRPANPNVQRPTAATQHWSHASNAFDEDNKLSILEQRMASR